MLVNSSRDGGYSAVLIEPYPPEAERIRKALTGLGQEDKRLHCSDSVADALSMAGRLSADVVLLGLAPPGSEDLAAVHQVVTSFPDIPCLILTGCEDVRWHEAAVRFGAHDILPRGRVTAAELDRSIRLALQRNRTMTVLRSMSDRWESLVDAIPFALFLIGPDRLVRMANRFAHDKLFPRKAVGALCCSLVHGRSQKCDVCMVEECIRSGSVVERDFSLPGHSGRSFLGQCCPVFSSDGSVEQVLHVVHER